MPCRGANCREHDSLGSRDVAVTQFLEFGESATGYSDRKHNRGHHLLGTTALRNARTEAGLFPAVDESVAIWPGGQFIGREQLATTKWWWAFLLLRSGCFRKTAFTRTDRGNDHITPGVPRLFQVTGYSHSARAKLHGRRAEFQ